MQETFLQYSTRLHAILRRFVASSFTDITGQEIFFFLVTNSGPVDGPASAAAAGMMAAASGSPMTTASKASGWARCCAMATGICQVDLSTQA